MKAKGEITNDISADGISNHASSGDSDQNTSGTREEIDTQLTQPRSRRVRDMEVSSFTYFARDGDEIKIGTSFKPEKRIRGLAREVGRPLETLAIVPLEVADEGKTHLRFAHLRVHGEWFRAEADLLQFIEEVKSAPVPAPAVQPIQRPAFHPTYDFSRPKIRLNPTKTISKLLKMRSAIGARTPAGHRISNIDEIRQHLARTTTPDQAAHLEASLARQLRDLEQTRQSSALSRGRS
jgi:hypothetical protein